MALVAGVLAACTPAPTEPSQFCKFWDKVEVAPPTADSAVLVKTDVVALADDTTVTGNECTDSGAKVALDGAVLAQGEEVPSEQGNAGSDPLAAVTGSEIAAQTSVLQNVQLNALSADITESGIRVRGNVSVSMSGQTSTIGFVGTLTNLDNWSVTLSSSALTIPGITSSPATFSGTLKVVGGVPSLSLTAAAASAKIGDITVSNAKIDVSASPATGVKAAVSGTLAIGPSTVSGVVDVNFDQTGKLVSAKAEVDARLRGLQVGGKVVELDGLVTLQSNGVETVASFKAAGVVGDLIVNEANGSLTLGADKATLVGVFDVQQGPNVVRFSGSIVWQGITAAPSLTIEGAGEISGTLADGQRISVVGNLSSEMYNGQMRTVISGAFQLGTLKATGSAVVETNGATTTLQLDAALQSAGFSAQVQGAVIITDGVAETVQLDASVTGPLNLGDATLTGASLSIRSTQGNPLELKMSGGLKVGTSVDISGTIAASFGPNGGLLSLDGQMTGSLNLGSWALLAFNGRVTATSDQITLVGAGGIQMTSFPLGVNFNGTFTSSLHQPTWSLSGTGKLRIASIEIASARLQLSQTAGMRSTRSGFYFSLIGIPFYFEADFYMKPAGGCDHVTVTGGSFLMRPALALALPGVIGCPVQI